MRKVLTARPNEHTLFTNGKAVIWTNRKDMNSDAKLFDNWVWTD